MKNNESFFSKITPGFIKREVLKSWMPFGDGWSDTMTGAGSPVWMNTSKEELVKGFMFNPTVYMIVSYITRLASQIPWVLYEVKEDKYLNRFKQIDPLDSLRYKIYEVKGLEQITGGHKILDIWERPNELQGQSEFIEQLLGYKLTTGDAFIHGSGPETGPNKGQYQELHVLPSQLIGIKYGGRMDPVSHYYWKSNPNSRIPRDQVMHNKFWNPLPLNQGGLYGLSPLMSASKVITRNNDSLTASVKSLQNMGAMGIISGNNNAGDKGLTEDQALSVEKKYKEKYGGPSNRGKVLITGARLKWQQMGMSPVELELLQLGQADLRAMCSVFGLQSQLFNDPDNKTYNNMREAKTAAYTQSTVPNLRSIRDEINRWWIPAFAKADNKSYWLDLDLKAVPELQEDIKDLVSWLKDIDILTPNEKREVIDYGESDQPGMDLIWVDQNKIPIDQAMMDVDQVDKYLDYLYEKGSKHKGDQT